MISQKMYFWILIFRKPTRPSLPLRKAPPFPPSLSSIVFTTPSVPLLGDRNPQGREDVTLSGAQNRYAIGLSDQSGLRHGCAGWDRLEIAVYSLQFFCSNLLMSCRFLSIFLVVSRKKSNFGSRILII